MSTRAKDPTAESALRRKRKRSKWRKHLDKALSRAEPGQFLRLMWSLRAIDRGEFDAALKYGPRFSQEQLTEAKEKQYFSAWTLETLINEYLCTYKKPSLSGLTKILDVSRPDAAYYVLNAMKQLENAEEGIWLQKGNVLHLMGPHAQRQFPWRRGFGHFLEFYRPLYIFDFEEARQEFLKRVGISMETFIRCGFALTATSHNQPFIRLDINLNDVVEVKDEERDVVLNRLSLPVLRARKFITELRRKPGMAAYKPSVLRQHPYISFPSDNVAIAPLPELVSARIADGIYYDIAGSGIVRHKAGRRFEQYVAMIIREHLSDAIEPISEARYNIKKGLGFDTPDLRLKHEGEIFLVVECKARRASHHSRFADSPTQVEGLDELAHGVFQIWRYFSHVRRGLFPEPELSASAVGLLLTLDTWGDLSDTNRQEILRASRRCSEADPEIISEDMRPVAFLHIRDVEGTLASATPLSFKNALRELLADPQHMGWGLRTVHDRQMERSEKDLPRIFGRLPLPGALSWWPERYELKVNGATDPR